MTDLPRFHDFEQATSPTGFLDKKFKGRGSNMAKVDGALLDWWALKDVATTDQKLELLYKIVKECKRWMALKDRKKPSGSKKSTGLTEKRRVAINDLGRKAVTVIRELDRDIAAAYAHFQARKAGRMHMAPIGQLKSLSTGYALERQYYLQTGKRFAYAGSEVSNRVMANVGSNRSNAPKKLKDLVAQKEFEDMSLSDFEALAQYGGGEKVAYLNKIQRLKHLATVNEDGLFEDIHGHLINMTVKSRQGFIDQQPYAMDQYGNIFVVLDVGVPGQGASQVDTRYTQKWFNHSSYLAGREALCAGCVVIKEGQLVHMDNNSGHYKPSVDNLRTAATFLRDVEHADLSDCRVVVFPSIKMYKANTFIDSPTAVPDWSPEDDRRLNI